jgi:hypothetical protein
VPAGQRGLVAAIDASARYLVTRCGENGRFTYRVNTDPGVAVKPRYNMVRHAGTMYALAMHYRFRPDDETRRAILRSARFLTGNTVAPLPERPDLLAVWSLPVITNRDDPCLAKLGASGLGLVALSRAEQINPGTTPRSVLRGLGKFILFMQKEDGSFYFKYFRDTRRKGDAWTSLYYPGEAALGLVMLHRLDPSSEWLEAAVLALTYLARLRRGKGTVEADHWALLATAAALPTCRRAGVDCDRDLLVRHAVQICESILATRNAPAGTGPDRGCFTPDGRTCPTAIRLEGLQAALAFLPGEQADLRRQAAVAVEEGLQFLLRARIPAGKYAGGMPRAIRRLPSDHPARSSSFNRRATEIRIDYVQHALSAMIMAHGRMASPRSTIPGAGVE